MIRACPSILPTPQESQGQSLVWVPPKGSPSGTLWVLADTPPAPGHLKSPGSMGWCGGFLLEPCLGTGSWEFGWAEARPRGQVGLGRHLPWLPRLPHPNHHPTHTKASVRPDSVPSLLLTSWK